MDATTFRATFWRTRLAVLALAMLAALIAAGDLGAASTRESGGQPDQVQALSTPSTEKKNNGQSPGTRAGEFKEYCEGNGLGEVTLESYRYDSDGNVTYAKLRCTWGDGNTTTCTFTGGSSECSWGDIHPTPTPPGTHGDLTGSVAHDPTGSSIDPSDLVVGSGGDLDPGQSEATAEPTTVSATTRSAATDGQVLPAGDDEQP